MTLKVWGSPNGGRKDSKEVGHEEIRHHAVSLR